MKELSERGNKTKGKIVEAARELFHKNGVRATSIDQILESSKTGKSQFYHYFSSKDDVIHEVLLFYMNVGRSGQGPITLNINSWEDLQSFFYDHIDGLKHFNCERSCPVGTIGNELASDNKVVREDISMIFGYMKKNISDFISDLKSKGKLKKSADPDSLSEFCIATVQGALLLAKVNKDSKVAENTVDHALKYLKTFSK